jgi:hypothetical protein
LSKALSIIKPNTSSEVKLDIRMKQLKKADEIDVPNKIIKLQGPKQKASPEVRPLIQDAKYKHKIWVERNDKIQAQRKLRKQMRKEKYNDRQKLYFFTFFLTGRTSGDAFHLGPCSLMILFGTAISSAFLSCFIRISSFTSEDVFGFIIDFKFLSSC